MHSPPSPSSTASTSLRTSAAAERDRVRARSRLSRSCCDLQASPTWKAVVGSRAGACSGRRRAPSPSDDLRDRVGEVAPALAGVRLDDRDLAASPGARSGCAGCASVGAVAAADEEEQLDRPSTTAPAGDVDEGAVLPGTPCSARRTACRSTSRERPSQRSSLAGSSRQRLAQAGTIVTRGQLRQRRQRADEAAVDEHQPAGPAGRDASATGASGVRARPAAPSRNGRRTMRRHVRVLPLLVPAWSGSPGREAARAPARAASQPRGLAASARAGSARATSSVVRDALWPSRWRRLRLPAACPLSIQA